MKAAVLNAFGDIDKFSWQDIAKPIPKREEVRIRIKASGFNPVDCKMRQGAYHSPLPLILGADCSGIIDMVGEEFHEYSVGDEVIGFAFGQGSNGTYAEYICLPKQFVVKKPKYMSFEVAASFPLVALTAHRALISCGALQANRSIFIAGGTGGVGSIALKLAKIFKANPIFTTAGSEESIDYLIKHYNLPKEHVLDYRELTIEKMKEKLIKANKNELIDVAIDLVGGKMKQLCFELVGFSGHVSSTVPEGENFPIELWQRGKSIGFQKNLSVHFVFVGAEAFTNSPKSWNIYRQQLSFLLDLIEKEELVLDEPEIVGNFSLEIIKEAHRKIEMGHTKGKLVMKMP